VLRTVKGVVNPKLTCHLSIEEDLFSWSCALCMFFVAYGHLFGEKQLQTLISCLLFLWLSCDVIMMDTQEVKRRLSSEAVAAANRSGRWKNQSRRVAHNSCCRRVAQTRALCSVLWKLLISEGLVEALMQIEIPLVNCYFPFN